MADHVDQQFGNYRIIRLLRRGGFAEVYLGEHIHLGTQAAIKVLHTQLTHADMEQFRTEARTIAHLEHPNIVRVLDFGVEDSTPFLVMSYAPLGTLRDRHPMGIRVALTDIVTYVKQVAAALQYAHDKQLIHRDIKPENLLLGRNNEVLLSDFGLALIAQSSFQTMEMAGTMPYTAPEQLLGKPRKASDQYALGIVVYEWISGDCPFHGSVFELATQHMHVPPPPLREKNPLIPAEIEEVVLTALAKDPQQRFAHVRAFARALEQACQINLEGSTRQQEIPPLEEHPAPGGMNQDLLDQGESIYWTRRGDAVEPTSTNPETIQQGEKVDSNDKWLVESNQSTIPIASGLDSVFLFNEPLSDPAEFYGRVRERETLLNRARKGASTSIVGPRRIGKTWLMSYVKLVAPMMFGSRMRVGYLDATTPRCATIAGFTSRVLEELNVPHIVPDAAQPVLAMLETVVQDLKSKNQLALLCIDEFEGFGKRLEFTLDFYTSLRAISQAGLALVTASRSPLIDIVGDDGKTSGFFNVFEQLTLEPFSVEEAQVFTQAKGIQAGFSDQERDRLLKYGQIDEDQWPPIRLQLVGKMLQENKTLAERERPHFYRPNDPSYWQEFEQRMQEKYRGVVR